MTTSHGKPAANLANEAFLYRGSGPVSLHLGDARQVLAALPDASVDCLVTSPPFWGLRDYGTGRWQGGDSACSHPSTRRARRVNGSECSRCGARWVDPQYGLEESLDDYVTRLVAVFDQARRVLVETGTLWLNLGDSYSTGTTTGDRAASPVPVKNLNGVPWKVAFALQTSGWTLFSGSRRSSGRLNVCVSAAQRLMAKVYGLQQLWCKSPVACRDVVSPSRGWLEFAVALQLSSTAGVPLMDGLDWWSRARR